SDDSPRLGCDRLSRGRRAGGRLGLGQWFPAHRARRTCTGARVRLPGRGSHEPGCQAEASERQVGQPGLGDEGAAGRG
ncbi:MAG: hypothetical protein ACK55I_35030, partial [bacterium]